MPLNLSESVTRLKRLVPRLRGKRIGVVGDVMLDRYLWGTASHLSPEAPVPVVDFMEQSECLGGAGNVAANVAALGGRTEAFGAMGNDEPGRALRNCLRQARDRKSTRLNSSHLVISYAVFCLKKKKKI